ncbi:MAG: diacylglycerol kinase family lipid kinase [Deltaproteobacteria bacterium]|nr:diacylglycerol kinase family lipid kinase [Deltaproteobacteria bacterium]MBW2211233.1 diacylglycerol kinase family lipid kinase [Deltaproteobacteria bacterium]MBW2550456.1 diacylglycerol kinase family lipid kinase [Deltaproteobacteria bacterium]MBW2627199.1 diacylglycerol kinase family lipid kinase [Deltaproteobacteria bacterium]MBW2686389.1 diacylglycerol kinase family lipid kinase [Deltaproteobacteria bacterium]
MSATYYAIVNRAAGGGRCAKLAQGALEGLKARGLSLEVAFTEGPKHATELAKRAAASGFLRFLSVGGDGTASEIVNGLVSAGVSEECELAMLPLGTGNSFLRDFGITNIEAAADAIIRGDSAPIDVLRLTHEAGVIHFINTMGTGFVADVGELTNERFKFLGAAGYIAAVLVCVVRLRYEDTTLRYADTIDDARTVLTSFSNSQYTGGSMRMAPDAQVADGLLDVVRAGTLGRAALIAAFARIFSGTHTDLEEIWTRQVDRVEFVNPSSQAVLIDGDLYGLKPHAIDVLPGALRLVA